MYTSAFGDSLTASRIGHFINSNGRALGESFVKLASGKSVSSPSDGVGDYFRTERLSNFSRDYDRVSRSVDEVSAVLDFTESANRMIWDDLSQMQGMVKDYYAPGTSSDMQAVIVKQFNEAKMKIAQTQEGAVWDGKAVLADSSADPLISVNTNPHDLDQSFSISFGSDKVVNAVSLDISAGEEEVTDALDEQFGRAASFAAQLTGYKFGLISQRKMAETVGEGSSQTIRNIQDVDEAKELFEVTRKSVQQQAAMSMLAQSGMSRSKMLMLVGM